MSVPTITKIGPADHGRRMSLEEFAQAEGEPGYLYELARGVVTVIQVPKPSHEAVLQAFDIQVRAYQARRPGVIHLLAPSFASAVRLPGMVSERHPDRSLYLTPPPQAPDPWSLWVPAIVVEVVSESSRQRDYGEKRQDYLTAGAQEYWIIDPEEDHMLALQRRGDVWQEQMIAGDGVYTTALLPDFELNLLPVLSAA